MWQTHLTRWYCVLWTCHHLTQQEAMNLFFTQKIYYNQWCREENDCFVVFIPTVLQKYLFFLLNFTGKPEESHPNTLSMDMITDKTPNPLLKALWWAYRDTFPHKISSMESICRDFFLEQAEVDSAKLESVALNDRGYFGVIWGLTRNQGWMCYVELMSHQERVVISHLRY